MINILSLAIWLFFHPVHVSITSIEFISGKDTVNVFIRLYVDDFLLDCSLNSATIDSSEISGFTSKPNVVMEKYLNEKVSIAADGRKLTGKLKTLTIEENEARVNIVYLVRKSPEKIVVRNTIMTSLYQDQANLVAIKVNDFEEGIKMGVELTEKEFLVK